MSHYLKKLIKVVRSGRTLEYVNKGIRLFILPYFTWAGIKIKGQGEYRLKDLNNGLKERSQNYLGDNDVLKIIESYLSEKKIKVISPSLIRSAVYGQKF